MIENVRFFDVFKEDRSDLIGLNSYNILSNLEINLNLLSANSKKWSNTLKQFAGNLPNCLSVFEHFVGLALKGLNCYWLNC